VRAPPPGWGETNFRPLNSQSPPRPSPVRSSAFRPSPVAAPAKAWSQGTLDSTAEGPRGGGRRGCWFLVRSSAFRPSPVAAPAKAWSQDTLDSTAEGQRGKGRRGCWFLVRSSAFRPSPVAAPAKAWSQDTLDSTAEGQRGKGRRGFWFRVSGFGFRVSGFWFLVSGFWFAVRSSQFAVRRSPLVVRPLGRSPLSQSPSLTPSLPALSGLRPMLRVVSNASDPSAFVPLSVPARKASESDAGGPARKASLSDAGGSKSHRLRRSRPQVSQHTTVKNRPLTLSCQASLRHDV
jgi:hypothetical protein